VDVPVSGTGVAGVACASAKLLPANRRENSVALRIAGFISHSLRDLKNQRYRDSTEKCLLRGVRMIL
jgi:hypothetical protein